MKYHKIVKMLGLVVALSLILVLVPVSPAMAAYDYDVTLDPDEGKIGDTIGISGEDFPYTTEESEKWVNFYFSDEDVDTGDYVDDELENYEKIGSAPTGEEDASDEGEFEDEFEVPEELTDGEDDVDVEPGTYYVYTTMTYADGEVKKILSKNSFTVTGSGTIELNSTEGYVGEELGITGSDFAASTAISLTYNTGSGTVTLPIEDGDHVTNSHGNFTSYVTIPSSTGGKNLLTISIGSTSVSANFTVYPEITLSKRTGAPGDTVTASGTGFSRRGLVTFYLNNNALTPSASADTKGSFTDFAFTLPTTAAAGTYNLDADDDENPIAHTTFSITESSTSTEPTEPTPSTPKALNLSQDNGPVGTILVVGGTGFKANSAINVTYNGNPAATGTADASGLFLVTFTVPASMHGANTITANDGTSTGTATFTIESVAPAIPQPLSPAMGLKVSSPVTFDWDPVTDNSAPVTYTLQIASGDTFSESSLLLDKEDITASEYTLSDADLAKLPEEGTTYYWRIRATDAAANTSSWTGAGEFSIGKPFSFTGWPMYTTFGIGLVLVFLLGLWIGRRSSFGY
jgi:hypothetical protein